MSRNHILHKTTNESKKIDDKVGLRDKPCYNYFFLLAIFYTYMMPRQRKLVGEFYADD